MNPEYLTGTIIKSTGSWYNIRLELSGNIVPCRMVGKFRLKGFKITNPVAVGDHVLIELDKEDGTIKEILPRKNYVVRQSPRKKHQLHLLASNIDQAVLIATIIKPNLKQGFIDRFLLMTEPYDIPVIIVFNKSDIYEEGEMDIFHYLAGIYENIGYKTLLISAKNKTGFEDLKILLKNKISLMGGQSGVGKSTIINAIQNSENLKTTGLSDFTGKGKHTTTFAEMIDLKIGGSIIDSPGIKTLSFNHLEIMDVAHNFREFFEYSKDCKFFDCTHRNEPNCAVLKAIERDQISELRYLNYLKIVEEIEEQNYWERHKDY